MPATTELSVATSQIGSELKLLQGVWKTVAGRRAARLLIVNRRYTFEFGDGVVYMGTFVLDTEAEPRRIDMYIEEGPAKHKSRIAHCIFQFKEGVLMWSPAPLGSPERLDRFPSLDDPQYLLLLFERVPPSH